MKLGTKTVLAVALLLKIPVLVGMMHEVDPTEFIGNDQHTFDEDPTNGKGNNDSAIIDVASSTHEDQSQINQSELLQPRDESRESLVGAGDALPGSMPVSADVATVDQPLDPFDEISLDDEPVVAANQPASKTKVQKFVDAVKKLWNDFWSKLTGRKSKPANSLSTESSITLEEAQPLTVDEKTQLRNLALQDPSNFTAATTQAIADSVGQASQVLRNADKNPDALSQAREYAVATYEPLQLATKTLSDLAVYVASPKKFDLAKQQSVVKQQLSEQTFFPTDFAGQRDLYTQLGTQVLQPRDDIYGANSQVSELAVAYRHNRAQQMLTDNPAWHSALKLAEGSSLGVDAQGAIVVHDGSVEQQLTDDQYASLGQAYAQELPDAYLTQKELLMLARAKMTASRTPEGVKASLKEFVSCMSNDFYYGDFAQLRSTGKQPANNTSLRAPNSADLQRIVVARQSLESDYRNAIEG